jgi:hypothetical protein
MGGLLVVGVRDGDDGLVGIEPLAAEAQLWVKDTLRTRVLPMVPFRARWLETGDDSRGILLVLVEESTATPHFLSHSGAIYVRNPGSSDPLPVRDQRQLYDLLHRGEDAERVAEAWVAQALPEPPLIDREPHLTEAQEVVALAATGVAVNFERSLFSEGTPDQLALSAWGPVEDARLEGRWAQWGPDLGGVMRVKGSSHPFEGELHTGVAVSRQGGIAFYRGHVRRTEQDWREAVDAADSRAWLDACVRAGRSILENLGAHGRLRLGFRLNAAGRILMFLNKHSELDSGLTAYRWTTFDADDDAEFLFEEIARNLGYGPRQITWT